MNGREAAISRRLRAYRHLLRRAERAINRLAVARLAVFLTLVLTVSFSFGGSYAYPAAIATFIALAVFLYLLVVHDRRYRSRKRCETAIALLVDDAARAECRLADIGIDNPLAFERGHPFAFDLDMDGPASPLKFVDNCFHHKTKSLLKRWLNEPGSPETIRARQNAVAALAPRQRFRLKLAIAARLDSFYELSPGDLDEWLASKPPWSTSLPAYALGRILALTTCTSLVLNFVFQIGILPWVPLLVTQLIVFFILDHLHRPFLFPIMEKGRAVKAASAIIGTFENLRFEEGILKDLQTRLLIGGRQAGPRLKGLIALQEHLEHRANAFAHWLLNGLFLWDQHVLFRLRRWRGEHGQHLPTWIGTIFEIEALGAVANFSWLFPEYPFPELAEDGALVLETRGMGHPCIPADRRGGNDYTLAGRGNLDLITGSNMSGKSTFLRTIGVNLVLTRLGAPVCATAMRCSLPVLWTSIRIQDSLAEGVSYFYAEVQRLKAILDEIQGGGRPVLYLLDEILKGTNSRERLVACKALVGYLTASEATGLITTHDLELLELARQFPERIRNFHFQEQIRDGEMFFDYRLRAGELTSTNALRLMRAAGVGLDFGDAV